MPRSRLRTPHARTCSRSGTSSCRGRARRCAKPSRCDGRTSVTDGGRGVHLDRVRAADCCRRPSGRGVRGARARARDHLSVDACDQLRAGGDGDVHDVHLLVADEQRLVVLGGVPDRARDRLRRRHRDRAHDHPTRRERAGDHDRDRHARACPPSERVDERDLGRREPTVSRPVLDPHDRRRRRPDQRAGHRHRRRLVRPRRAARALLPLHEARARPARGGAQSRIVGARGRPRRLDARVRLGAGRGSRRRRRDDGRADPVPRPEHDAGDPALRIRGRSAGWSRQSDRRGRRWLAARGRHHARRALRRLRRRRLEAPSCVARHPAGARRQAERTIRPSRGAPRVKLKFSVEVLGLVALAALIAVVPSFVSSFTAYELATVGMYFIALLGLSILTGYSGQISLGHGAFMAVGGYTTAVLTVNGVYGHHIRDLWTIPIAGVVAGVAGLLVGIPALRLSGLYLALVTFGIAVSFRQLPLKFDHFLGGTTGKVLGLLQTPFGLSASPNDWIYYLTWGIAFVLLVAAWAFVRGKPGRTLKAIRDSEIAAISSGISVARYKTLA